MQSFTIETIPLNDTMNQSICPHLNTGFQYICAQGFLLLGDPSYFPEEEDYVCEAAQKVWSKAIVQPDMGFAEEAFHVVKNDVLLQEVIGIVVTLLLNLWPLLNGLKQCLHAQPARINKRLM